MEVVSVCPLPVASLLWQKGPATWVFTVVCKATYTLAPGESPLAQDQEALNEADDHWNDDAARSVRAPGDLAPLKLRADVVLVGSAFAPGGVPVRSLVARLAVNKIDKAIEALPDRALARDGRVDEGAGFTRMPLVYERAAGGPGTSNPVGMRRDARDAYDRLTLPNLQPQVRGGNPGEPGEPIGFGPIGATWPQRVEKLGRHASTWARHDWKTRPLPGDLDVAYFNVAPPDQQVTSLRENERLVLDNLHREHARLITALPGIRPCAFVEGRAGPPIRLPMHADTLWIDTDRGIATVVWRRQIPLDRHDDQGRVFVAMEKPGQSLTWSDVEPLVEKPELATMKPPPPIELIEVTASVELSSLGATLPPMARSQTVPFFRTATSGGDRALPFLPSAKAAPLPAPAPLPSPGPLPSASLAGPSTGDRDSAVYALGTAPPSPVIPPPAPSQPVAPPLPVPLSMMGAAPSALRPASPPGAAIDSPWASAAAAAPSFVAKTGLAPSVLGVSNAAAEAWPARPDARPIAPAPLPVETPADAGAGEILELLWFDHDSVPRVRRNKAWKPILAALELMPVDRDLDDPALADEPVELEDRREVFEILAQGPSADAAGVDRALDAAVRKDGKFVAQLALVRAELSFAFDELSTLKALVATVTPFVTPGPDGGAAPPTTAKPSDDGLKGAVEAAREFLKTADELTPPAVAEGMSARIRDAFAQTKRAVPETHLTEQTDRVLLSQRRYQKRIVFGAPHLRCLVRIAGEDEAAAIPGYLPEGLAKKLPMFQRFGGRLIAEVQQQADQYEKHHAALRIVALARATARGRR